MVGSGFTVINFVAEVVPQDPPEVVRVRVIGVADVAEAV
jgi:hypothetical protein